MRQTRLYDDVNFSHYDLICFFKHQLWVEIRCNRKGLDCITILVHVWSTFMINMQWLCSRRNFGLARNLIRRIISPNQDDLSYSIRISFPGCRNWVSCQTQSLWLNNAVQCRRLTGGSSIAAAAWTHEGTYLIYGFLVSIFF